MNQRLTITRFEAPYRNKPISSDTRISAASHPIFLDQASRYSMNVVLLLGR
jgi:hypothetical protein